MKQSLRRGRVFGLEEAERAHEENQLVLGAAEALVAAGSAVIKCGGDTACAALASAQLAVQSKKCAASPDCQARVANLASKIPGLAGRITGRISAGAIVAVLLGPKGTALSFAAGLGDAAHGAQAGRETRDVVHYILLGGPYK